MTAPSYTEDLADINLADGDGDWSESSDVGWDDQGPPAYQDPDYPYIQGQYAVTADCTKTGVGTLLTDYGSGVSIPADGAFLVWVNFSSPQALATYANGGIRILTGDTDGDFYAWKVGGSDYGRYPYGGWQNFAANPGVTPDYTVGTGSSVWQFFGAAVNVLTGIGKGEAFQVDAIRAGRCSSIFEYGEEGDYCTFAGYAAQNDNGSNRWGLVQAIAGGYLYKGKMTLGTAGNAVDFRDSNVSILIDDTPKVTANFNTIEINNASSRVDWDNIKFTALGSDSPGRLVCNADADLNWDSCQFTDMGAFDFGGTGSTCTNAIWNGCGQVTAEGAVLNGSQIVDSTVAADDSVLVWDVATDPDGYLDNMTISKGTNAHHAIELGTLSPYTVTLRGWTTAGFNASNDANDSTIYVARTSGEVTINVVGGDGNFSYKSAGASVNVVINPVTVAIHVEDEGGNAIQYAQVYIQRDPALVYTSSTGNSAGDSDFLINQTPGSGQASAGWVRAWRASDNVVTSFRYSGVSGSTFSLLSEVTGTGTTAGGIGQESTQLVDSTADFGVTEDVVDGDAIRNVTDGSWGLVDEVVSTTELKTTPLSGGTDNEWDLNDVYSIHRLPITYASGDDVDIPLYMAQTDSNGDIPNYMHNYSATGDLDIIVRVRYNEGVTKYIPFDTSGQIDSSGYGLNAVLQEDEVAT